MAKDRILERPDGSRIGARAVRRGLWVNIVAGAVGVPWFVAAMQLPMTMFMVSVGAGGLLLGLKNFVVQAAMLVQIPFSLFAERLRSRKRLWVVLAMVHRPLLFVPVAFALMLGPERTVGWITVAACGFIFLLANMATPLWHSWMADFVPEESRGRFWGKRQAFSTFAGLTMFFAAAGILHAFPEPGEEGGGFAGFAIVFGLAAVLGTLDIVIHCWVPEPRPQPVLAKRDVIQRLLVPYKRPVLRRLILAKGAWAFSLGMIGAYGPVYLKLAFDVSYVHLTVLSVTASLGGMLTAALWGYVIDRIGPRVFSLIGMLITPAFALVWANLRPGETTLAGVTLPTALWWLLPVNFVSGCLHTGLMLCSHSLTAAVAPRRGRSLAMAVYWTSVGVLAGCGAMVGGAVVDWFRAHPVDWTLPTGAPFGFIHVLVVLRLVTAWFVAVPLMVRVRIPRSELPLGTALRRVFLVNPLRIISSIYYITAMGGGFSARSRARAAEGLGRQRSAIAVADLVDRLDDPAAEVREQAALALGRIGSPEAVAALVAKLSDRGTDLAPQIARALRESGDGQGVDALLDRLPDGDREFKREGARALGALGDRRAAPTLLEILRHEPDEAVATASGEALARLGEIAAIYELMPRMKRTRNPVLRRSLAVAVGNLLGEPDGFYPVLVSETATPGQEVTALAKRLHRRVERTCSRRLTGHGRSLLARIDRIPPLYDEEDFAAAVAACFDVGLGLAALAYGIRHGEDARAFLDELIWRDERLGVGMWFLDRVRRGWNGDAGDATSVDEVDVLLGVYFLAAWAGDHLADRLRGRDT